MVRLTSLSLARSLALTGPTSALVTLSHATPHIHVYQPAPEGAIEEFAAGTGEEADDEEQVMAASVLELPSQSCEGVWER